MIRKLPRALALTALLTIALVSTSAPSFASTPAGGSPSETPSPTPSDAPDQGDGEIHAQAQYEVRVRVANAVDQPLDVLDRTLDKGHWAGGGMQSAAYLKVADQTLQSESGHGEGDVRWRIGDSGYLLKVYANANKKLAHCAIQTASRGDANSSPFACEAHSSNTNKDHWNLDVVVEPSQAKTNNEVAGNLRRAAYESLCATPGVTELGSIANCAITVTNVDQKTTGQLDQVGDVVADCGAAGLSYTSSWKRSVGESTTVGGSIGFEFETPYKVFNEKAERTFQSQWTSTRTYGESTKVPAPDGTFGWLLEAPREQAVTADVTAVLGNQTFVLPDVEVLAPLSDQADKPGWDKQPHNDYLPEGFCTQSPAQSLFSRTTPRSIDETRLYAFGAAGANQRVFRSDPKSPSGAGLSLAQYEGNNRDRWQPAEVPGVSGAYTFRADSNLDLCLAEIDGRVVQATCASNSTTQQWRAQFGSDGNVRLQSVATSGYLGLPAGNDLGAAVWLVPSDASASQSTWSLISNR